MLNALDNDKKKTYIKALKGQVVNKQLCDTVERIQACVGKQLFEKIACHQGEAGADLDNDNKKMYGHIKQAFLEQDAGPSLEASPASLSALSVML